MFFGYYGNSYVKKSDAVREFNQLRVVFAFATVLVLGYVPYKLWDIAQVLVSTLSETETVKTGSFPFFIENMWILHFIIAASGMAVVGFIFSGAAKRMFENRLEEFASLPNNEMIKRSQLYGKLAFIYLGMIIVVGLLHLVCWKLTMPAL